MTNTIPYKNRVGNVSLKALQFYSKNEASSVDISTSSGLAALGHLPLKGKGKRLNLR